VWGLTGEINFECFISRIPNGYYVYDKGRGLPILCAKTKSRRKSQAAFLIRRLFAHKTSIKLNKIQQIYYLKQHKTTTIKLPHNFIGGFTRKYRGTPILKISSRLQTAICSRWAFTNATRDFPLAVSQGA
jgi:hypothetical protein